MEDPLMKKLFTMTFAFLLLSAFIAVSASAQWTTSGLSGKFVEALAVSGTNLFAGTDAGVFLSTNNGTSWTETNTGLTNTFVHALAVNSTVRIFAATDDGVFVTTNNGTSWAQVNTGLTSTTVTSFAVSGSNLFAGTTTSISGSGVFLSANNGGNWSKVSTSIGSTVNVNGLFVTGSNLFAATEAGAYFTTNSGTGWTQINSGLANTYVYSFAVIGTNLFAGTKDFVFRSTNNGTSWTAVNTGYTDFYTYALAVNGTTLIAGTNGDVLYTANNGGSWANGTSGLSNPRAMAFAIIGANIYVGTADGVWKRPLSQLTAVGGERLSSVPDKFVLEQNYPNPFNGITNYEFRITNEEHTNLKIYVALGRERAVLVDKVLQAGVYRVRWDAATCASGVYYCVMRAGSIRQVRSTILMK